MFIDAFLATASAVAAVEFTLVLAIGLSLIFGPPDDLEDES